MLFRVAFYLRSTSFLINCLSLFNRALSFYKPKCTAGPFWSGLRSRRNGLRRTSATWLRNLGCALPAPLVAPAAGGRAPSLVIRPVAAVLPPPVGAPASLPPLQGPMPLAPPAAVVPVPAVVEVLRPLWGPPLTGSLGERVRRQVPEVRATAATCTGREGTGAALEAAEVGRWEAVGRVPGRVLVIDLLRHDRRRRRMRQRRDRKSVV